MWYRDEAELRTAVHEHGSIQATAIATGVPRQTLQTWASRFGITSPHPNAATTGSAQTSSQNLRDDASLASITNAASVPQTDSLDHRSAYLKSLPSAARSRADLLLCIPARESKQKRRAVSAKRTKKDVQLIALVSDQHCPHEDFNLDACWLAWCAENRPDRIVGLGDILNLSKPSRHRQNLHARHNDTPTECFQAGRDWWRRTLEAAKCSAADQLLGNHDVRHQIGVLQTMPELYDVKRPGETHPWWDIEYMMGLDELGVTLHRAQGEYHESQLEIAPGLLLAHGTHAGPTGGAHKAIAARHETSRAQGHDHKQALTYVVRYRDGEPHQHVALSVGTMARRDLGYVADPDSQQGFATLTVHPDGYWNVELARYDDRRKRLVWRDQLYSV